MLYCLLATISGAVLGVVYGQAAATYHWWVPPNWVGHLLHVDGETAYDMSFVSLIIDAAAGGLVVWVILKALSIVDDR
jgi:hypothetical protein